MHIGSLVFATEQGLGYLAKSFYDNGIVTDVMCIRHRTRSSFHREWYGQEQCFDARVKACLQAFVRDVDMMLFFETPFDWSILDFCREARIKTAIMPMYECMPKMPLPAYPDLWLCPSLLDEDWCKSYNLGPAHFIPIPVNVPWKRRYKAEVFVHNSGHGGLLGRNGTQQLIEALPLIKSPARFIIRSQEPLTPRADLMGQLAWPKPGEYKVGNVTVDYRVGTEKYEHLWCKGDVFVFPERFNGLSLPLQEARAAGMLVIATDRYPMNTWLPKDALIPVSGYRAAEVAPRCSAIDDAIVLPEAIAKKVDEWYGKDIEFNSLTGRDWAAQMTWNIWKPIYLQALSQALEHPRRSQS